MTRPVATATSTARDRASPAGTSLVQHARAFLDWWFGELAAILPDAARARLAGDDRRVSVSLEGDTLQITDLRRAQRRPVCRISLGDMNPAQAKDAVQRALRRAGLTECAIVLGLPEHMILRRPETLPAGSERRLGDILRLKLENTAPLPAGAFHWGYRITGSAEDGRLAAECVLVKAEPVETLAARLKDLGLELAGIFPEQDLPGEPTLNLMPDRLRREPVPLWSPMNRGLAALAAVLAILALVMTFLRQDTQIEALNAELADLRSRAKSVLALRSQAQGQLQAFQAVREAKGKAPPLMDILDEVSRLLPDGTWVNDFRLRDGEVQLTGQSESASSLIGLIERSRHFDNVRFGSPVVRDQQTGAERFNIRFEWTGTERKTAQAGSSREKAR